MTTARSVLAGIALGTWVVADLTQSDFLVDRSHSGVIM
jgi:hypothetical protein